MEIQPKELSIKGQLNGISERTIDQHYNVLYKGYVNKLNEIHKKVTQANMGEANPTFSEIRELKREEVFTTNAVRLHEQYFDCLGGRGGRPDGAIGQLIQEDFGSYEAWEQEFRACGAAARGWVVLAFDWQDMRLRNYLSDIHSDGVWGVSPLLILDTYEHAYYMDQGAVRKGYLDAFFQNANWDFVNSLIERMRLVEARKAA